VRCGWYEVMVVIVGGESGLDPEYGSSGSGSGCWSGNDNVEGLGDGSEGDRNGRYEVVGVTAGPEF
jgi:hypothetical protein